MRSWDRDGCDAPALAGTPLEAEPSVTIEDDGRRRVQTYALPSSGIDAGALVACSPFGDIDVVAADGDAAEVSFVITSRYAAAVERTVVEASFRDDGGHLAIGGWVARVGGGETMFGGGSASVRIVARLPASGAWDVRADSSAGDLHASDLLVGSLRLHSDFGDVVATGIDLAGNATLTTSAGDVILGLASAQTGAIDLRSDFGDVEAELPQRADIGYDVVGSSDFGDVVLRLGATEQHESDAGGAGEHESARTVGFATQPTQVTVRAETSAGDVRIVVAGH